MDLYLAIDGQPHGPLAEAEVHRRIAAGEMQPEDYCWQEGWSEWRTLLDVFPTECRAVMPPPLPAWATRPAPVRPRHLPARRDQMSTGIFIAVAGLAVVTLLIGIVWSLMDDGGSARRGTQTEKPSRGREAAERRAAAARADAEQAAADASMREEEFSGDNLEQIAQACVAYAEAHDGQLPTYSAQLRPLFGPRFAAVMDVPETPEVEASGYVVRMGLDLSMPDDTPIAFEARPRVDGSRAVAFLDGSVRVLPRGDPVLVRALSR